MAESLEEFFSDNDLDSSEIHSEAAIIHEYLANNTNSAANTAQALIHSLEVRNAPLRASDGQFDISTILEDVIVSIAEVLLETQDALVNLLVAIKQQAKTSYFASELAFSLSERWLRYGDPDPSLGVRDEIRDMWTNLNRFAALIYIEGLQDLSGFGIRTIGMAWRRGGWRVNWEGESTSDSIIALDGHAPAAAHWILVCGQHFYDNSREARENWAAWDTQLEWVIGQSALDATTKSLCEKALAELRRIAA